MEIYCIRDSKAGHNNLPFFQQNDIAATRAFRTEVNRADPGNMAYLYPEEFDLCHIGTWSEKEGVLDGSTARGRLINGKELKTPPST